jgi:hypothetical protein
VVKLLISWTVFFAAINVFAQSVQREPPLGKGVPPPLPAVPPMTRGRPMPAKPPLPLSQVKGIPSATSTKDCKTFVGETCFDNDLKESSTKGFEVFTKNYEKMCSENKAEYCYILYRYYLAENSLARARTSLKGLCKDYYPYCLNEISRLLSTGDSDWAEEVLNILCQENKSIDSCSPLKSVLMRTRDREIFSYALNSWRVKTDLERVKTNKSEKKTFLLSACKSYYYLASDFAIYNICDTDKTGIKVRLLGSLKRLERNLREAPPDIPFMKSVSGTAIDSQNLGGHELVTLYSDEGGDVSKCPSSDKFETLISSTVNSVCGKQDFEGCRFGDPKKCDALEKINSAFSDKTGNYQPNSHVKSYGAICRQNWTLSWASRCEPSDKSKIPVYQFVCGKDGKNFSCEREAAESLENLGDADKELADLLKDKCKFAENASLAPPFDLNSFTFIGDNYAACVLAQVNKNPKQEFCNVISAHAKDGTHWPDVCWLSLATKTNNKEICEKIKEKSGKQKCITLITAPELKDCNSPSLTKDKIYECARLKSQALGLDFCVEIPETPARDHCYYELALNQRDPFYCKKIRKSVPDKSQKEALVPCVMSLAKILNAPNICDLVPDPSDAKACAVQLEDKQLTKGPQATSTKKR